MDRQRENVRQSKSVCVCLYAYCCALIKHTVTLNSDWFHLFENPVCPYGHLKHTYIHNRRIERRRCAHRIGKWIIIMMINKTRGINEYVKMKISTTKINDSKAGHKVSLHLFNWNLASENSNCHFKKGESKIKL